MPADIRRARTAFLVVGVLVPLVVLTIACLVVASWIPDLPDPVATHWSGAAGPDGFGPSWTYLAILAGLGGGLVLSFAALGWFAHRLPASPHAEKMSWSPTARLLAATNLALSGMLAITALAALAPQRGLEDAALAPDVTAGVVLAFVAMAVLAVLGWFLQPTVKQVRAQADAAAPLPVAAGERVAWFGTAAMGKVGGIFLVVALVGMTVLSVALLAGGQAGGWTTAIMTLVVAALVVSTSVFRVRVSGQGLRVRSVVGFPSFTIPATEVRRTRVTQVSPLAEFGGWGLRKGMDGRFGVVVRAGEALEVDRTDGRVFVVTIDDAAMAAAALAAAADGTEANPTQGDQ